jgi:hypothetical protein
MSNINPFAGREEVKLDFKTWDYKNQNFLKGVFKGEKHVKDKDGKDFVVFQFENCVEPLTGKPLGSLDVPAWAKLKTALAEKFGTGIAIHWQGLEKVPNSPKTVNKCAIYLLTADEVAECVKLNADDLPF